MYKAMKEKVENDSVAYIKSIAEQRGRNVAWAEDAVRKSVSVTEREALKLKVIDQEMQRAIARQAEAERERRAKVIHAEGEFEASRRLGESGLAVRVT